MTDAAPRRSFWELLRTTFTRGLVVIVPVVITGWVLSILFNAVDSITAPVFEYYLDGRYIPGLGFISMIVLILLIGAISRNLIANAVFRLFERIISTIPLARTIYSSMKDLINAFGGSGQGRSFRQVLLIEYPRVGLYTIGFATNELTFRANGAPDEVVSAYIPNPPNPTSGIMILVPRKDVRVLDMTVEEGLKMVLSGGIVTATTLSVKQ